MTNLLVVSRKFPPSVGGTQTVLKNLFASWDPQDYFVLHGNEGDHLENSFSYKGKRIGFPPAMERLLGKLSIPLSIFLIPIIIWKLFMLQSRRGFDKLLIVYPDPFYSIAGYAFARLSKKDYVLYFHDLFEEAQMKPTRIVQKLFAIIFERRMIERASLFLVISGGLKNFYEDKYDVSPLILSHSLDLEHIHPNPTLKRKGGDSQPIKVVYSGEVYDNQYDAFLSFVKALRGSNLAYKLLITSKMNQNYFSSLDLLDENTTVTFFHDREKLYKTQRYADVLYLPLAFNSPVPLEVKTSLPTKIFEYIASMSPMLVHCPKGSFLEKFCKTNGIGVVCTSQEKEDIINALQKAIDSGVDVDVRKYLLSCYDREKVGEKFKSLLEVAFDGETDVL